MKKLWKFAYVLLPIALLTLSGCGGGGNSSSGGVFDDTSGGVTTGATTPAGTAPPFSLVVNTDINQVDANIGTVLATAQLKNASSATVSFTDSAGKVVSVNAGAAVPDQVVTFTVLAGPATVGATTPVTDVNGLANAIVTTQDAPYTSNVLLEAKTVVLGVTYRAYTSIQIIRGIGVINIPIGAPAAGTLATMERTINPSLVSGFRYIQQIPFKLTDSNGNPRVGVPVTLSVYSQTGSSVVTINYHAPTVSEPSAATVTTDSAGQGIFNVTVDMNAPPVGITLTDSVVYKAVTNDSNPVTAYVGGFYTLTSASPLAIAPETVTFGTQTTIQLTVSGGAQPYSVSSSNPSRVSVSISGNIVTATLVDTSAWTTPVIISVTDAVGQTKSSILSR